MESAEVVVKVDKEGGGGGSEDGAREGREGGGRSGKRRLRKVDAWKRRGIGDKP